LLQARQASLRLTQPRCCRAVPPYAGSAGYFTIQ